MPKRKKQEPMTVTGRIVHMGPSNSPRCVIEDPSERDRRWVLQPGGGNKSQTSLITISKGSRLHEFVKAHKYLRFNKVSEQPGMGDGNVTVAKPAARKKRRNTITNVQRRYLDWKKEKNETSIVKLPQPMDETSMNGPTPKRLLETAAKMSPKAVLEGKKKASVVEKPVVKPAPLPEPPQKPVEVIEPKKQDPEPSLELPEEPKFAIQPVSERTELSEEAVVKKLDAMEHEDLIEIAVFNSIDLGRTRTPQGALNKIYKCMESGEKIRFPE